MKNLTEQPGKAVTNRIEDRTDKKVIKMWLKEKSEHTQRAYSTDIKQYLNYINHKELKKVILEDLQDYKDHLLKKYESKSTVSRKISTVKSLISFAHKIGYLIYNVSVPVTVPTVRQRLNEKILSEEEITKMLSVTKKKRDYVLIRTFYASAARISEVTNLQWRDIKELENGAGIISIWGKGEKERHIRISKQSFKELLSLKNEDTTENDYVFTSQKGNKLSTTQAWRIVKKAAIKAEIKNAEKISPHYLRHSHVSHALDRGAPIHLVRDTAGHSTIATTDKYAHINPDQSSSDYLIL